MGKKKGQLYDLMAANQEAFRLMAHYLETQKDFVKDYLIVSEKEYHWEISIVYWKECVNDLLMGYHLALQPMVRLMEISMGFEFD